MTSGPEGEMTEEKRERELEQVYEGQWVQPVPKGYLMGCCNCGARHLLDFRIYRGKIQMRGWLAPRARVR